MTPCSATSDLTRRFHDVAATMMRGGAKAL